jgi:glucose/mannose-6-phosphate isomerase
MHCEVPIIIYDEESLPKWCKGEENLIIGLVNSSNLEKMEKIFLQASNQQCSIFSLLLSTNFDSNLNGLQLNSWLLEENSFSRTTLAYDVMVLYGLFHKLDLAPDISNDFPTIFNSIQQTLFHIDVDIPSARNPAKRLAGQMIGRWIKIVGGGFMKSIAQRWSNQINESAKTLAFAEDINQSAHHSLSGIYNPENITNQSMVIFLKSRFNDEAIEGLIDTAKEEYMCNGIGTDVYVSRGETKLSQLWSTILFGDFVAYYLAIAYECDPTPTAKIELHQKN